MFDKQRRAWILDNLKIETPVARKEFCRQEADTIDLLDEQKRGSHRMLFNEKKELSYHKQTIMGFTIVIPACMT